MSESSEHKKIKNRLSSVFERLGLLVDTEVRLDLDGDGQEDYSFDVCVFCEEARETFIFAFECKSSPSLKGIRRDISAWRMNRSKILANRRVRVVSSNSGKILARHFRRVSDVKLGYAVGGRLSEQQMRMVNILAKSQIGFYCWDSIALTYFERLSAAIGEIARYEIYKELHIFEHLQREPISEPAVEIHQRNYPPMYLLGINPARLLRIGYVTRRISGKPMAYQRAISKERISNISKFLSERKVLLPNSVIIAFDSDANIQRQISFSDNVLQFPSKFCSAWIVDGQHRIYGFGNTKHGSQSYLQDGSFKLPVVAFRKLDEMSQNRTFVNINYFQKKIDPTLFCDLATVTKDLRNELTWPSLLGAELNKVEPWRDRIKISEFDHNRAITLSSFARYTLLEILLGYNKVSGLYSGLLYKYAPFDLSLEFESAQNRASFYKQFELLKKFFQIIYKVTTTPTSRKNKWDDFRVYALTKATGVNALMLVLFRILERYHTLPRGADKLLKPIGLVNFSASNVNSFGGGWRGFRGLANHIIRRLNASNKSKLNLFLKR